MDLAFPLSPVGPVARFTVSELSNHIITDSLTFFKWSWINSNIKWFVLKFVCRVKETLFKRTSTQQFILQSRLIVPKKGGYYGRYQFNINYDFFDFIHNKK